MQLRLGGLSVGSIAPDAACALLFLVGPLAYPTAIMLLLAASVAACIMAFVILCSDAISFYLSSAMLYLILPYMSLPSFYLCIIKSSLFEIFLNVDTM